MALMDLFKSKEQQENTNGETPLFREQLRKFVDIWKLKLKNRDAKFYIISSIALLLILYVMGVITSVIRFFGEASKFGLREAPKPTLNPFGAYWSLIYINYSFIALLVVLVISAAAIYWYIRNRITLGDYQVEERGGLKYKKQVKDATLGSARELTDEEIADNFLVVSPSELRNNNPCTIIYGRLESGDYVLAKPTSGNGAPNLSSFIVGDAGSRKTTNFIVPLLMQIILAGRNAIVTDKSGEIFLLTYWLAKEHGYNIRVLNTIDPDCSDSWNFVGCIGNDIDLAKVYAQIIYESTELPGSKGGDEYFVRGMLSLLPAMFLYVNEHTDDKTITNVLSILINNSNIENLEAMFEILDDNDQAKIQFKIFQSSPVSANFLSNATQRLDLFVSQKIRNIFSTNGINIEEDLAKDNKTIIYIITQKNYSFLSALFLNAATRVCQKYADMNYPNHLLPRHLYFVYDEFLTMGYVPNMGDNLSELRKYGMVFFLICQAWPQFKRKYGEDEAREIIENCRYKMLFGAGGPDTAELFEKFCGPATVRAQMTSSSSPILKETQQMREMEQQRMLYDYNELMTFPEDEYLLFTTHLHPLRLYKPYYKFLPGGEELDKHLVHFTDYEPQYKPQHSSILGNSSSQLSEEQNIDKPQEEKIVQELLKQVSGKSNKQNDKKSKPAKRKKVSEPESRDSELPLFRDRYYIDRSIVNKDEVFTNVADQFVYFKERMNAKNEKIRAYSVKYDIPSDVTVNGTVPENQYFTRRYRFDLSTLDDVCKLQKEGYIQIGWSLLNVVKNIASTRIKTKNGAVDEKGKQIGYTFTLPDSDMVFSPLFKAIPGYSDDTQRNSVQDTSNAADNDKNSTHDGMVRSIRNTQDGAFRL